MLSRAALLVLRAQVDMLVVLLGQGPRLAVERLAVQLRADALEHLASLVEGLDASEVLQELLLLRLRHGLGRSLRRRGDPRRGRI